VGWTESVRYDTKVTESVRSDVGLTDSGAWSSWHLLRPSGHHRPSWAPAGISRASLQVIAGGRSSWGHLSGPSRPFLASAGSSQAPLGSSRHQLRLQPAPGRRGHLSACHRRRRHLWRLPFCHHRRLVVVGYLSRLPSVITRRLVVAGLCHAFLAPLSPSWHLPHLPQPVITGARSSWAPLACVPVIASLAPGQWAPLPVIAAPRSSMASLAPPFRSSQVPSRRGYLLGLPRSLSCLPLCSPLRASLCSSCSPFSLVLLVELAVRCGAVVHTVELVIVLVCWPFRAPFVLHAVSCPCVPFYVVLVCSPLCSGGRTVLPTGRPVLPSGRPVFLAESPCPT
jgi:hypothetical protein